jgi:hypothetical protein
MVRVMVRVRVGVKPWSMSNAFSSALSNNRSNFFNAIFKVDLVVFDCWLSQATKGFFN